MLIIFLHGADMDLITTATLKTVNRFNEAFNKHNVDQIMALMTDDCIFENTRPVPPMENDLKGRKLSERFGRKCSNVLRKPASVLKKFLPKVIGVLYVGFIIG